MARFAGEADLEAFLGSLDPDYSPFAPALWQTGVRTARQLANASKPLLLTCGLPELYIDDIKATAARTGGSEPALASRVAERVLERVVERVLKKQRHTLTSLEDVGEKLLSETTPDSAWFDNTLAGFDYQAAVSFFESSVGRTMRVLWSQASEDKHLQVCLNQMIPQILTSLEPHSSLTYYDTHASGLRGAEVRIDCTITDGPRCPAHVVTSAEATFSMKSHADQSQAVGQMWQRLEQLGSDQDMREKWTVAIVSHSDIQFWQLQKSQIHCHCSSVHSFSLSLESAGFQMLCRWLASDPQALGYSPPQLPSPISFGNNEEMHATAKVFDNSCKHDAASTLHGRVMVFSGRLSDKSQAIAKLPATGALFDQEVENLELIRSWPDLSGSVVHLRGIGHTSTWPRPVLILQPVGCLVPYDIGHEALLNIMKQFALVVKQLSQYGYIHGDLSYYNLLKHQDTDAALLVDMQTLMPLQQVLIPWLELTMLPVVQPLSFVSCKLCCCVCRLLVRGSELVPPCLWGGMSSA
ncbi:hypothetical protein ABBQ38_004815 [Trebouxia sp. C0009 RCD-2024]